MQNFFSLCGKQALKGYTLNSESLQVVKVSLPERAEQTASPPPWRCAFAREAPGRSATPYFSGVIGSACGSSCRHFSPSGSPQLV